MKSVGSAASTTRTADQTYVARYWAEHPAGTWSRIFRDALGRSRDCRSRQRTAVRDALLDRGRLTDHRLGQQGPLVVLAADHGDPRGGHRRESGDARPIRLAAADPNSAVPGRAVRAPGLSGSFVATLQDFFGTRQVAWTDTNNAGLTRSYTHFSQAIDEIVDAARVVGHPLPHRGRARRQIARQVAHWREKHFFKPAHHDDD